MIVNGMYLYFQGNFYEIIVKLFENAGTILGWKQIMVQFIIIFESRWKKL